MDQMKQILWLRLTERNSTFFPRSSTCFLLTLLMITLQNRTRTDCCFLWWLKVQFLPSKKVNGHIKTDLRSEYTNEIKLYWTEVGWKVKKWDQEIKRQPPKAHRGWMQECPSKQHHMVGAVIDVAFKSQGSFWGLDRIWSVTWNYLSGRSCVS